MYSFADLISIEVPNSELRDMDRVRCKYFGTCAGCQYQVGPSQYPRRAHRAYRSCIDAILRDATWSQAQRGCECLPELLQFATFYFPPLLE
jgi:hypothetical protein